MDDQDNTPLALDIHALATADAQCGHTLSTYRIARKLRAIQTIAMVLSVERPESVELGGFIRGGLIEAIDELAAEATSGLERPNGMIKTGAYLPK